MCNMGQEQGSSLMGGVKATRTAKSPVKGSSIAASRSGRSHRSTVNSGSGECCRWKM